MAKVAVVTGGASGIGQAVVERFATDDILPVILDIDEGGGKTVAEGIQQRGKQVSFMRVDVTNENDVQSTFAAIRKTYGCINILVNVAGGSLHRHPFEDFPLADWQRVMDLNLTSTFLCCRAVVELMKTQQSGAIINISSDIGYSGAVNRSAYAAAKAGIVGLTKTLALELAPFGVHVNAVAPGRIETPRVRATYSDAEWVNAAKNIPFGHAGQPEDVADAVAFLAGAGSRHLTGQTIHVNGGRIMT